MSDWQYVMAAVFVVLLSACDIPNGNKSIEGMPVPEAPERVMDTQVISLGQQVFKASCAECHGANAEGAQNWRKRDADGHYPAPPLNGSGHAWHHSLEVLRALIENGSLKGKGKMPAWKGKLSDQEIEATMAWFQSLWPQPVYDAWYEMQQRGR